MPDGKEFHGPSNYWLVAVVLVLAGCAGGYGPLAMSDDWCAAHDYPARHCTVPPDVSWDQGHLKQRDGATCPTAIYVVVNGELEQCPPM